MADGTSISIDSAYDAMCWFLQAYWERGDRQSEDLAILLSSIALEADGSPADPAMSEDWREAISRAQQSGSLFADAG